MRKLHYVLSLSLLCGVSHAGIIAHTDYTAGSVITAAGQNTNENTIVNEFNGNISAANLATNAVTTVKLLDSNVTYAKLDSTTQSTFTYVNTFGIYRRPVLTYISATAVDIEANTGTSNQTCVQFPNEQRCVTENTSPTSVNRRFIISENASNSGTKNSGLRSGYIATNNTWYALYAWKVSDNSTDFVIVGDTVTPVQANYSALNTAYGTNQWVYLGMIAAGDGSASASNILKFVQVGNQTAFYNACATQNAVVTTVPGILLAVNSSSAASLTYSYTNGTNIASRQIPAHLITGTFSTNAGVGAKLDIEDSGGGIYYFYQDGLSAGNIFVRVSNVSIASGLKVFLTVSSKGDIMLASFTDGVLGVGYNPQL